MEYGQRRSSTRNRRDSWRERGHWKSPSRTWNQKKSISIVDSNLESNSTIFPTTIFCIDSVDLHTTILDFLHKQWVRRRFFKNKSTFLREVSTQIFNYSRLYLFFNEIINQMSSSLDSLIDDRIDICDLIQMNQITAVNVTATENDPDVSQRDQYYHYVYITWE